MFKACHVTIYITVRFTLGLHLYSCYYSLLIFYSLLYSGDNSPAGYNGQFPTTRMNGHQKGRDSTAGNNGSTPSSPSSSSIKKNKGMDNQEAKKDTIYVSVSVLYYCILFFIVYIILFYNRTLVDFVYVLPMVCIFIALCLVSLIPKSDFLSLL